MSLINKQNIDHLRHPAKYPPSQNLVSLKKTGQFRDLYNEDISDIKLMNMDGHCAIFILTVSQKFTGKKIKSLFAAQKVHCLSRTEIKKFYPLYTDGIDLTKGNVYSMPIYCDKSILKQKSFCFKTCKFDKVIRMCIFDFIILLAQVNAKIILY
jgi:prolyl-tRNA editing enzyme YbaK/EbsC (Cys-tRNA(Pro) deacylase)